VRWFVLVAALGCAEYRMKATFPEGAAGQPVVYEQALVGISDEGDAAVVQLIDAEGAEPRLSLLVFARGGGPTRAIRSSLAPTARAVAERVRQAGRRTTPILGAAVAAEWPEASAAATALGYAPRAPATPAPGRRRWAATGRAQTGSLPLALRLGEAGDDPRGVVLLLSESPDGVPSGDEMELARVPLTGTAVAPELWLQNGVVWLEAGSFLRGEPLHRSVGVLRGSLARGEAELHNLHGLADYNAGDLDAARREFDRAISADPNYVDGLYNAASVAALSGRTDDAIALLRRAVAVDPGRVQVLGRNDDDLKVLRKRSDVRALLGLRRPPPEGVPPPP